MSDIFDEATMHRVLGKYIPNGETLLAGIHAIAKETKVTGVFANGVCGEDRLIPEASGGLLALSKEKYSTYDVYLGLTSSSLVIAECERNRYYYQFEDEPDVEEEDIREVTAAIPLADIGTCFPLADIQSCALQKGWMGSVRCFLTMKNGSYFKLLFPKRGGLGGGMPHHTEYREAMIARLRECGV